jgi:hypothetical protein
MDIWAHHLSFLWCPHACNKCVDFSLVNLSTVSSFHRLNYQTWESFSPLHHRSRLWQSFFTLSLTLPCLDLLATSQASESYTFKDKSESLVSCQHVLQEAFWYIQETAEYWVISIRQIQVNIPGHNCLPLLTRPGDRQDRQMRRLKCNAGLSSFNWHF